MWSLESCFSESAAGAEVEGNLQCPSKTCRSGSGSRGIQDLGKRKAM
jgi:hypothetical protein